MSISIILAYTERSDHRGRDQIMATNVAADVTYPEERRDLRGRNIILLGVGPIGCFDVARRVAEGLDRIAAVVLVGPEAPWAEPEEHAVYAGDKSSGFIDYEDRLPLGPLEPLRAAAERARGRCVVCGGRGEVPSTGVERVRGTLRARGPEKCIHCPPRLVIACHPEPVACAECGGVGYHEGDGSHGREDGWISTCDSCNRTGKALGSAEVAWELGGFDGMPLDPDGAIFTGRQTGGLVVMQYSTRVELEASGIGEALREAMRQ